MTFFERYENATKKHGLDPCSEKAATMIGITKSAPSMWKKKNITPGGETVASIANAFHVSADYLLGRTNDPTDYCTANSSSNASPDASKTASSSQDRNIQKDPLYLLCTRLDDSDRLKVQGVIQGLLMHDKYLTAPVSG